MIGKVERPDKNIRYKLMNVENEYYILDQDKPIWAILFPFIFWLKSHTVYQIDQAIFERLKQPEEKKTGKWAMILPVAFISPFLGRILASLADGFDNLIPAILTTVLLIVFIVSMISIRIYVHLACYKKTDRITGGLESLPKKKIKIRPKRLSNYLAATVGYVIFLSFFILGGVATITYNNPTLIIVSIVSGSVFLIINTGFINIGNAKVTYIQRILM